MNFLEKNIQAVKEHDEYINPAEFIRLEEELLNLKQSRGLLPERNRLFKLIDRLVELERHKYVNRRKYILLALSAGWLCGAHRFYSGRKLLGILYLLFFWTGIPFAMTLIDLMTVLPMKADEKGGIII